MNSNETGAFIFGLLFGIFFVLLVVAKFIVVPMQDDIKNLKQKAIENKTAIYSPDTGEFTWVNSAH